MRHFLPEYKYLYSSLAGGLALPTGSRARVDDKRYPEIVKLRCSYGVLLSHYKERKSWFLDAFLYEHWA